MTTFHALGPGEYERHRTRCKCNFSISPFSRLFAVALLSRLRSEARWERRRLAGEFAVSTAGSAPARRQRSQRAYRCFVAYVTKHRYGVRAGLGSAGSRMWKAARTSWKEAHDQRN